MRRDSIDATTPVLAAEASAPRWAPARRRWLGPALVAATVAVIALERDERHPGGDISVNRPVGSIRYVDATGGPAPAARDDDRHIDSVQLAYLLLPDVLVGEPGSVAVDGGPWPGWLRLAVGGPLALALVFAVLTLYGRLRYPRLVRDLPPSGSLVDVRPG